MPQNQGQCWPDEECKLEASKGKELSRRMGRKTSCRGAGADTKFVMPGMLSGRARVQMRLVSN